jgi:hypothetical protein
MRLQLTFATRRAGLALLAAAALSLPAAPAAGADGMAGMSAEEHARMSATPAPSDHDSMPGMSAEQHAHMPATPVPSDHDSMPGMSADEHAQMSDTSSSAGHDHASMPGMDMRGHDEPAADAKPPVGLVLGGFGLVNALVLLYAVVIRRRPDALKRRRTLERVRSTPPKQTVFAPSSPEHQS